MLNDKGLPGWFPPDFETDQDILDGLADDERERQEPQIEQFTTELAAWEHEPRASDGRWENGAARAADVITHSPDGFSVSVRTGGEPAHGYMVAKTGATHTFPADLLHDKSALATAIDQMLMSEPEAMSGDSTYLGGWVHDGKLWLEPSQNVQDHDEAVQLGRATNQIAIWDVDHGQEIQTGGSGGGRITEHDAAGRPVRSYTEGSSQGASELSGAAGDRAPQGSGAAGRPGTAGIAAQLDLSWKDAWLHERRGPDGRWTRGGGTALVGSTNYRMFQLYGQEHDPVARHHMELAGYAYETGDNDTAASEMDKAAATAALPQSAQEYRHLASKIRAENRGNDRLEAPSRKIVAQAVAAIPAMFGGQDDSQDDWNGTVQVFDQSDIPGLMGALTWDGTMRLRQDMAQGLIDAQQHPRKVVDDPEAFIVPLHELLHGLVPKGQKYDENMDAYQNSTCATIEEGFTELGSIQHMPEFLDKMGMGGRATRIWDISLDGMPAPNPAFVRSVGRAADEMMRKTGDVRKASPSRGDTVAEDLEEMARELKRVPGDLDYLTLDDSFSGALGEVQHLGDSDLAQWAMAMRERLAKLQKAPHYQGVTLRKYYEQLQDANRIETGDVMGIYPGQTKAAWNWVSEIARDELGGERESYSPGSAGWKRTVELADEINRYGDKDKPRIMALQVARNALKGGPDAKILDDPAMLDALATEIAPNILKQWGQGDNGPMRALRAANDTARASAHAMTMATRGAA